MGTYVVRARVVTAGRIKCVCVYLLYPLLYHLRPRKLELITSLFPGLMVSNPSVCMFFCFSP